MALKQRLLQRQVQKMIMSAKMQQSMHMLQLPILELNQLIAEEMATNPLLEESATSQDTDDRSDETRLTDAASPAEGQSAEADSVNVESPLILDEQHVELNLDWLDNDNIWASDFFDKSRISQAVEKHNFQQTLITTSSTLQDELTQQFRLINDDPDNWVIAEQIIGNIDENGYLATPIAEIAQSLNCRSERVEHVLKQVQCLEPAGVGARNLKECLLIQLKSQNQKNSYEEMIVENFLNELATKKYIKISKALKIPLPQVKNCAKKISQLDPKPGRNFSTEALRIIPDVILEKTSDNYEITINSKTQPKLSISKVYKKLLKDKSCTKETIKFIKEKLQSAQNLISGLNQREQTLERVARCIIEYQKDFIKKGIFNIKPLILKQIAEKLDLHPSTISRTVSNKYIQTPYGTIPLKKFFSQAIASEGGDLSNQKIKVTIDELIKTEAPNNPLSDQQIVKILVGKGIHISRRTVTKYRNALKVPPAYLRRR